MIGGNGSGDRAGGAVLESARVLAMLLRDVGFPILVAAYLLYELRPIMIEQVRQQAVMVAQLQSLGARSCTLPFERKGPEVKPAPELPPAPGAFRGLGLRHARPVDWSSSSSPWWALVGGCLGATAWTSPRWVARRRRWSSRA